MLSRFVSFLAQSAALPSLDGNAPDGEAEGGLRDVLVDGKSSSPSNVLLVKDLPHLSNIAVRDQFHECLRNFLSFNSRCVLVLTVTDLWGSESHVENFTGAPLRNRGLTSGGTSSYFANLMGLVPRDIALVQTSSASGPAPPARAGSLSRHGGSYSPGYFISHVRFNPVPQAALLQFLTHIHQHVAIFRAHCTFARPSSSCLGGLGPY